jgi:hypothetical protein
MLALDLLGMPFARAMHGSVQMPSVHSPMIGRKACEAKGLQQRFQLQKDLILTAPNDIGQDGTRAVIDGMPPPAWVAVFADKTLHFIHLRFTSALNVHGNFGWVEGA